MDRNGWFHLRHLLGIETGLAGAPSPSRVLRVPEAREALNADRGR